MNGLISSEMSDEQAQKITANRFDLLELIFDKLRV
jgi:hypothetical protein